MRIHLDDWAALKRLDSGNALQETDQYDRQFAEGWSLAEHVSLPKWDRPIRQILVLATGGGSAASVNLLRSCLFDELSVPLALHQGYTIPAYVDAETLVLVVSHSGNTEEVVSGYEAAIERGAPIVAFTSGGRVRELAEAHGHPCLVLPSGLMPRIALGYLFLPLLAVLQKLGLVSDKSDEVKETVELFRALRGRYGPDVPVADNLAKQIAQEMDGRTPVVYGTLPFTDAVAWRWKNQLGENGKVMAFWNAIPSLHHDEAVGWDAESAMLRQFHFTLLCDQEDSEKTKRRIGITADILRERAGAVRVVQSSGRSRLARLFSLVYLGDYVSLYLALARGVDPTPVDVIDLFKAKMGQTGTRPEART